jgi:predicted nucleic acid-binding protein
MLGYHCVDSTRTAQQLLPRTHESERHGHLAARRAVVLAREHGLSIYDALIVAAALEAGCDTLFSEDMQHQRAFGGMRIVNPFLHDAR